MSASSSGQVKAALGSGGGFVDLAWSLPDDSPPADRELVAALLRAAAGHLEPGLRPNLSLLPQHADAARRPGGPVPEPHDYLGDLTGMCVRCRLPEAASCHQ